MVVINGGGFSKKDSLLLETTNCDPRGMLELNQELVINKANLYDLYRMDKGEPFATGLYAQVRRCRSLRSHGNAPQSFFAAKFSPRKRPGQINEEECVENLHEIALLSQLTNPYIITFEDAFILDDYVVTIMEFAPGGDLQSIIDADLVLLEKDAARYIFELLQALKYLHERHIAHLDIKPQNLLLVGEFPACNIKLCDFEISRVIKPGMEIREILGTPDYVAPEILLYEPLSTAADMWSVGILAYVLLTGFSPFGGDTDQETFSNIIHEPIDFPDELFEDVSPAAIDFILKVAVKNAKSRPSCIEMEKHDWLKAFIPTVPEPASEQSGFRAGHGGPKKRSPRKTMALSGSSTASAAGRRPSARSILRACKSAYDLNKMGGKTKSREALVEKMKIASGEPSGGHWKLRKNMSKSREQLWESKIQLSKSCEKINNNLPGSTRWASIANFPSLDLNAMKSSTSQESVISVMSTSTNIGTAAQQQELLDWQQASLDDYVCPTPQPYSISMPNTPPIPNFDLSSPVNNLNMMNNINESTAPNMNFNSSTGSDFNYPSLVPNDSSSANNLSTQSTLEAAAAAAAAVASAVELESQKSVAELIMTFGGRVSAANAKKLDLKNQFEPILEVDGSEEQPMSLDNCSDNNSTSGVSSIIASSTATTPTTKEPKSMTANESKNESGNYSMNSYSSLEPVADMKPDASVSRNSSRRSSRTSQQIRDENRARSNSKSLAPSDLQTAAMRRGSTSPPKTEGATPSLKGILKKPSNLSVVRPSEPLIPPGSSSSNSSRRGSIPGNCTRLYDTHTISSLAKVPKRSILKNSQSHTNGDPKAKNKPGGPERSSSKSPENISPKESPVPPVPQDSTNETTVVTSESVEVKPTPPVASQTPKVLKIPKGLSPRERPSFILLNGPDSKPDHPSPVTNRRNSRPVSTKPKSQNQSQPKPKRQMTKSPESSFEDEADSNSIGKSPQQLNVNTNATPTSPSPSLQSHPNPNPTVVEDSHNKNSKFKSELNIEPAAVAIKIFPPDPIIIPKSSTLLLKSSAQTTEANNNIIEDENHSNSKDNSNTSNNNARNDADSSEHIMNSINSSNSSEKASKSPNSRRKSKSNEKTQMVIKRGEKSTWGIVCTGSVGRAMERFETGTIKGKKLRRGSVPDF